MAVRLRFSDGENSIYTYRTARYISDAGGTRNVRGSPTTAAATPLGGPMPNGTPGSSTGATNGSEAPPYSENPYVPSAAASGSESSHSVDHTYSAHQAVPHSEEHAHNTADYSDDYGHAGPGDDYGVAGNGNSGHNRLHSVAENESVANTHAKNSSSRRNIGESIKSYFRRGSQSSRRSGTHRKEGEEGDDEKKEKPEEPETIDDIMKKQEDPQYILNTILEEPEHTDHEVMMPVGEAAAIEASNASIMEDHPEIVQRQKGYRENRMRNRKLRKYTRTSRTISFMREWFNKFMHLSLFTRCLVYWLPLGAILFIPLAVSAWQNHNMMLGGTRVMWIFIWLEVVWGTLFIARLFAHYIPNVLGFLIMIFVPRYFKYVNMFLALEFAVQLVLWTFTTFISFSPILTANKAALAEQINKQPHWQKIVQNVCVALLVSAIVYFVEQVFMYILSTNFHRTRMALRIQKQKKCVQVLIVLLDTACGFFPWRCDKFAQEDEDLQFAALNRAQRKVGNQKGNNKFTREVNRIVGYAAKNVGAMIADANMYDKKPSAAKIVKKALTNKDTREVLACRIWKSLVMEDSNFLTYQNLIDIFGQARKEEVLFMFEVLDTDGQNGIDLNEMIECVNNIGRELKQISKSLIDIDGAITKLHYLLMGIALILIVVIFVGMLAPSSATVLATLGSTLLSFSFMFSSTAQEIFTSCIFLFVKHPFDVGDWIQTSVPSIGLVRMKVTELNLLYSVFEEIGVNTRRQVSNSVLAAQFIDNISRSAPSQFNVQFEIGIPETTTEQLAEFETRINEFLESNPRDYCPGVYFQAVNQTDLDRLTLSISINTRNSQDDIVLFSTRRTKALEFISQCINEIPITIPSREDTTSHDPALPVFQYNIKNLDEAIKFSERARGKRERFGMHPPSDETSSVLSNEEAIESDGYQDGPTHTPSVRESSAQGRAHNPLNTDGNDSIRVRRTSFTSKRSRHSVAFSTMSRASNTFGLRSRNTAYHRNSDD